MSDRTLGQLLKLEEQEIRERAARENWTDDHTEDVMKRLVRKHLRKIHGQYNPIEDLIDIVREIPEPEPRDWIVPKTPRRRR